MALDMKSLLQKPAGKAVKPPSLPVGNYGGKITKYEYDNKNKNNTPYARYTVILNQWPDNVTEEEKQYTDGEGVAHTIDLTKRSMRKDFYLTDDAFWRLDEFLKSMGIEGGTYEELIPKAVGLDCVAEVQQYVNQTTSEIGNQLGRLLAAE